MSDERTTIVDYALPDNIIKEIGKYVQLCARIEKLIIIAVVTVENLEGDDRKKRVAELSMLPTTKLISSLNSVTKALPKSHRFATFFQELRPYLHQFVDNRHRAVHGVVFFNEHLQVKYFDKKAQEDVVAVIEEESIDEMLAHADAIARSLSEFCTEFAEGF
ncbi:MULTISPECIES: hypothetical protein [Roseovarius]|uniref:hypothetical protein n=1 Tax=Roseovarius TaxID=74030 RepID=UPI00273EC186|nr:MULTISPECIES: hypothetical protein [unclassified Roseovarius]